MVDAQRASLLGYRRSVLCMERLELSLSYFVKKRWANRDD